MSSILLLATTIVLTVTSQVLQKQVALAAQEHPDSNAIIYYSRQTRFWLALLLLGAGLLCWLLVLHKMEVSKAYTLLSLNYVLMLAASRFFFDETIPPTRWFGAAAIVIGVACISWS